VVVGVEPGDGASMFAANLAVVFSQLGESTLLVDGNLRAPRQQEIFDVSGRQGLSDMLAGRADFDVVAKVPAFVDLSVLAAGTQPPNPQELLSRSAFGNLNAQLESRFDVVLYDSAAYAAGSDALAIAGRAGGALLVARQNKTPLEKIQELSDQLAASGAQVVGSVLVDF